MMMPHKAATETEDLRACGADDVASPRRATWQSLFSVWSTLNEHRWSTSRDRRGRSVIREGKWKLIEFHADGRRELFDRAADPSETRNRIQREPVIARKPAAKLDAWRKQSNAIPPQSNPNADPAWPGWNLTGAEKPTSPV